MKIKKVRGYIFSRSFLEERVPQHVQNIVIRDYCKNNNLHYLLSSTEYIIKNSHLMLEQVLNNLNKVDGIVAYSVFQLPTDREKRKKVYNKVIKYNKELHFAVEKLKIVSQSEADLIEEIWNIKQTLPFTPEIKEIKKKFK
ncbi:MAG: LIC12192 family sporadic carbohydrate cluster protein [Candidatus Pelagibacter sp.]|tara:strand:- start:27 stop:449 length:423 start_codon:yes stop_codon:yes gene_type:complete